MLRKRKEKIGQRLEPEPENDQAMDVRGAGPGNDLRTDRRAHEGDFEHKLCGESTRNLAYEKGETKLTDNINHRNDTSCKRVTTNDDLLQTGRSGTTCPPCRVLATSLGASETLLRVCIEHQEITYAMGAIESRHMQLSKIINARRHLPLDEAGLKLIWPCLHNVAAKWSGSLRDWKSAIARFALLYSERFNAEA